MNEIDRFEDAKRGLRGCQSTQAGIDFFTSASLSDEGESFGGYASFDPDNVRTTMGIELDIRQPF